MNYFSGTVQAESWDEARSVLWPRVGKNLENLRLMKGVSAEQVARDVGGMTPQTLRNYESGKTGISLDTAWNLADYYGVALDVLLGRVAYENPTVLYASQSL